MPEMLQTQKLATQPRTQSRCFACGPDHPQGLRLVFDSRAEGGVRADWTPGTQWEGYSGVVHGGIVSTVLDEAMSKAVAQMRRHAVTGELRIRYRVPVASGAAHVLEGWVVTQKRRLAQAEARLLTAEGVECAHAWATFVDPPATRSSAPAATESGKAGEE
jgi:uncharacterized protein (TIGR00369 family)